MADFERDGSMMHATDNATLSAALRTLADLIDAPNDIPEMAIREAADRIDELAVIALELLASTKCEKALPDNCPRCALSARLAVLGVMSA
jgi:hypothetical protein